MPLTTTLLFLLIALVVVCLGLLWQLRHRNNAADWQQQQQALSEQLRELKEHWRQEMERNNQHQRKELADNIERHARAAQENQNQHAQATFQQLATLQSELNQRFEHLRETVGQQLEKATIADREGRDKLDQAFARFRTELTETLKALGASSEQKLEQVRNTVEKQLSTLQADNNQKLEQMRATVDEKLEKTLSDRLGHSFKLVSERLEQVHKGLGEMQQLATGVGDLKRVLTNVKARGTWGEVQLGALLEQILAPEQFEANIATGAKSSERVEYAIKLPGRHDDTPVYLPIDAKFPIEDYQRLLDAQERADLPAIEEAGKLLETRLKLEAKTIREKYLNPPHTTDFAVLYLPTEGLYAEALRRAGLAEWLQREHRVTIAGPTTLAAMLNSLQMGFKTLAIEKRSSEVWQVLGAVKTEFTKFGDMLAKTKKKLQETANTIEDAERKTRTITRKLKGVEALPVADTQNILQLEADDNDTNDE